MEKSKVISFALLSTVVMLSVASVLALTKDQVKKMCSKEFKYERFGDVVIEIRTTCNKYNLKQMQSLIDMDTQKIQKLQNVYDKAMQYNEHDLAEEIEQKINIITERRDRLQRFYNRLVAKTGG